MNQFGADLSKIRSESNVLSKKSFLNCQLANNVFFSLKESMID